MLPRRAASLLHLRGGATLDALQPRRGVDCMETAGLLPIQLVDHTLPAALQTHEMLFLPDQPQDPSGAAGTPGWLTFHGHMLLRGQVCSAPHWPPLQLAA